MQILVVNGNTTEAITRHIEREAGIAASPGVEIIGRTARFGAPIISTRSQIAVSANAIVDIVAAEQSHCNAILLAVSFDPGLAELRTKSSVPVVGMTQASLLTACQLGERIGMIALGRRSIPIYRDLIRSYGLETRVCGYRAVEMSASIPLDNPAAAIDPVTSAAEQLIARDDADVVILLGAVMAGLARKIRVHGPAPILDGISCGLRQAELLARLNAK